MANLIRRDDKQVARPRDFPLDPLRSWDPFRMVDALLRWDPFREMGAWRAAETFLPRFDVKEKKDGYEICADMPGVKEGDLDISVSGNVLTISGKREEERKEEEDQYFATERSYGQFARSFSLPEGADFDNIKANLKDGVLTVSMAKKPEVQPKKITIGDGTSKTNKAS